MYTATCIFPASPAGFIPSLDLKVTHDEASEGIQRTVGSAGPIRFVVNEKNVVANVIDTALKSFAREGRLPVLGFDVDNFLLYSANGESDGMIS
ncbi:hypothetical protein LWI29_027160 [Acer saccharum]|uniref:DUF7054 domain-containing protein n=1 Tax=Acer saccharum TaxID=4024 RepID=A0AA39SUF5_ACESA|nr:hypothetical protein LWI29_027160 [Acer saccharum]